MNLCEVNASTCKTPVMILKKSVSLYGRTIAFVFLKRLYSRNSLFEELMRLIFVLSFLCVWNK